MRINWLTKIGNKGVHNAFTDLCEFKGGLYCCFREAKNHISGDGAIRVLSLDDAGNQVGSIQLCLPQTDLRDPKLSVMPNGNLLLIAYARANNLDNQTLSRKNICWESQTGKSWSSVKFFAENNWWLWRLSWYQGLAYGFGYNRTANEIHLYKGMPRRKFERHQSSVLSLRKDKKGYPNESDIIFAGTTAYALVRRDADSYSAQLGHSEYPFNKWRWTDLGIYIGGPAMIKLNNTHTLVAGRIVQQGKLVTGLLKLDLKTKQLILLTVLPSAGDNSYPGLVIKNNNLYVSYYSSHENRKTSVYLAKIHMKSLADEIK